MFTGIVQEQGLVIQAQKNERGVFSLVLECRQPDAAQWSLGDSVAVNGLCLTIVRNEAREASRALVFEVSEESLARSNLGALKSGSFVHIESALKMGAALGGHLVSGHIDAVGVVKEVDKQGDFWNIRIGLQGEARERIAPFLVEKGSIAVDGVSLTVNGVVDEKTETVFSLTLIPHTLEVTHFSRLHSGQRVNLEADLMAKYVLRYKNYFSTNTETRP